MKKLFFLFALCSSSYAASHQPLMVVIDPGHGGEDQGTVQKHLQNVIKEKDLTLAIAQQIAKELHSRHISSVLTRNADIDVSLDQRVQLTNEVSQINSNTIFISIHANSAPDTAISGFELFTFNATTNEASQRLAEIENGQFKVNGKTSNRIQEQHSTLDLILTDLSTTANFGDSLNLAKKMNAQIIKETKLHHYKMKNRGVRQALFYVLMQTRVPSILIEAGFLSNPEERARLTDSKFQNVFSKSLVHGILQWQNRLQKPMAVND